MLARLFLVAVLVAAYQFAWSHFALQNQAAKTNSALKQLDQDAWTPEMRQGHLVDNTLYIAGWVAIALVALLILSGDIRRLCKRQVCLVLVILAACGGCRRPFEPVHLEVISSHEEAFLLPYTGDSKKQTSSNNEEYLKTNMVYTKQVQIPQQWVEKGYETWGPNGEWRDAALLVKVDTSPVTREWTADPLSGTSNKNEAVWVMTSDQVEFSTGWTITARIGTRDDAVKFLHNYPNGSLTKVLDGEVRSKLQAEFGLEVTDLPMDTLRKDATPHIVKVVKSITDFFRNRGISITNLGITGGFVYKDKTILDTMVKVFNAEQERAVAAAESAAQKERNNAVVYKATGEAEAILKTRQAEADGIKMVADARAYELEKSAQSLQAYLQLRQLELQAKLLERWNGAYPIYFMGASGSNPNMLLQLPALDKAANNKKGE